MQKFNLGVIGSGPAGLAAAFEAQQLGQKVVIIEKYQWGGTCPNYGCDPKKILLSAVEGLERQKALKGRGLEGDLKINWPELMAFKQTYVDAVKPRKIKGLDTAGITHLAGTAHFIDGQTVQVGNETLAADYWIIATGQRPKTATFPGAELTIDSEAFLNLKTMPQDITFIGAGYIGVEFANISQMAGSHVHVVAHHQKILKDFDPVLTTALKEQMAQDGVEWVSEVEVASIQAVGQQYRVTLTNGQQWLTDQVVLTIGRQGNTDQLDAATGQIELHQSHVVVNQYLQTTNPHVYAIGDVADNAVPKLVPVGNFEGRYVARHLFGAEADPIHYQTLPEVVFGSPRIAQTGVKMADAQAKGLTVHEFKWEKVITFYRYQDHPIIRVALDQNGIIRGASVYAKEAEELINYFVTAINEERTLNDTQANLYAYPSLGSEFAGFYE
ncbi:dihydrolipoyl dehydrogenase family protein [Weissella kandleri]|uniref:dihydrolipoyl dehydrogenase family protein n=1 Tax=Weissella kandleri TaxID=1616 RepID=UPI00387EA98B